MEESRTPDIPAEQENQPALLGQERKMVLYDWNQTERPYDLSRKPWELLSQAAERFPTQTAISYRNRQYTYEELWRESHVLAEELRAKGVQRGDRIGLCLPKSPVAIRWLLASLQCEAAYIPIDPGYPDERRQFLLGDAEATWLVSSQEMDQTTLTRVGEHRSDGGSASTESQTAYILYTSGSTGMPKGVTISNRALSNYIQWIQEEFRLSPEDKVLQGTPLSFDASIWEIYGALSGGAQLVIPEQSHYRDPRYLSDLIVQEKVTVVNTAPTILRLLKQCRTFEKDHRLRLILSGGEAFPVELLDTFRRQPNLTVYNCYGPTEVCVDATSHRIDYFRDTNTVPIGRPIGNKKVYILDERGEPVPIGGEGEICVSGEGVDAVYLNDPEKTERSFVPNPFSTGERIYKTGDYGYFREDGAIVYTGRKDQQIKINGCRVELEEIRRCFLGDDRVKDVYIKPHTNSHGMQRLIAYIVADPAENPDDLKRDLLASAAQNLPATMRPSAFVVLSSLPLATSEKIDASKLPVPATMEDEDTSAISTMDARDALCAHVNALFGCDDIDPERSLFDQGLSSADAFDLMLWIEKHFHCSFSIIDLVKYPSIAQMAERIRNRGIDDNASCIELLREGIEAKTLLLLPPGSGDLACYQHLLRFLSTDRAVYGFDAHRVFDGAFPTSIPAMAERCVQALETMPKSDAYALAGFCAGGVIAAEMACQLHERGSRVDKLLLLDIQLFEQVSLDDHGLIEEFMSDLGGLVHMDVKEGVAEYLRDEGQSAQDFERVELSMKLQIIFRSISRKHQIWKDFGAFMRIFDYYNALSIALKNYQRRRIDISTVLLRGTEGACTYDRDPSMLGWGKFCTTLHVEDTPGTHFSMLKDHCRELADRINLILNATVDNTL